MSLHPAFDADRWYEAIAARRSRRAFDGVKPGDDLLDRIDATAADFRPFGDARVLLVRDVPVTFFTGLVGSYGKVTGARSALVFISDATSATHSEHCGYTGEGAVLEAGALGLTTCWIAGSFSRSAVTATVELEANEVVRAISPVGYPVSRPSSTERFLFGASRPKRRRPLEEIAPGIGEWPRWAAAGAESARIAPSAMNRQPWRFRMDDGAVILAAATPPTPMGLSRLDCGIAMLHFELGARAEGCDGAWEALAGTGVARWVPIT